MKKLLLAGLAGLLALSLAGCATSTGVSIAPGQLTSFQKGVTTSGDVIAALGKPNTMMSSSDGTKVFTYVSMKTTVKGATFVPIVGLFAGGAASNVASTTFSFVQTGLLISYQTVESSFDTQNGSSAVGGAPN